MDIDWRATITVLVTAILILAGAILLGIHEKNCSSYTEQINSKESVTYKYCGGTKK